MDGKEGNVNHSYRLEVDCFTKSNRTIFGSGELATMIRNIFSQEIGT